MGLIRVTSYLQNDDYTADANGLLVKDRLVETPALINIDDVLFIFPSKNGIASSFIKFRNGTSIDVKETIDEIDELANPPNFSLGTRLID